MDGRGEPQGLGDGGGQQRRVPADVRELLGVVDQVLEEEAEGLVGGLDGGHQDVDDQRDHLAGAHRHAVEVGCAERGYQVGAGVAAALFDDPGELGLQFPGELQADPAAFLGEGDGGDELADPGDPFGDPLPVLAVQAEDVQRGADGEGLAELVDEVHPPPGEQGSEQLDGVGAEGADLLPERRSGERPHDDSPLRGVLRPRHLRQHRTAHHRLGADLERRRAERLVVRQYPADVAVTGEEPGVEGRLVVHRRVLAQPSEVPLGGGGELLGQDAEAGLGHGRGGPLGGRALGTTRCPGDAGSSVTCARVTCARVTVNDARCSGGATGAGPAAGSAGRALRPASGGTRISGGRAGRRPREAVEDDGPGLRTARPGPGGLGSGSRPCRQLALGATSSVPVSGRSRGGPGAVPGLVRSGPLRVRRADGSPRPALPRAFDVGTITRSPSGATCGFRCQGWFVPCLFRGRGRIVRRPPRWTGPDICGQQWAAGGQRRTPGRGNAPTCAVGGPKGSRSGSDHSHE